MLLMAATQFEKSAVLKDKSLFTNGTGFRSIQTVYEGKGDPADHSPFRWPTMKDRWMELCEMALLESDSEKFRAILAELGQLLNDSAAVFALPEQPADSAPSLPNEPV